MKKFHRDWISCIIALDFHENIASLNPKEDAKNLSVDKNFGTTFPLYQYFYF